MTSKLLNPVFEQSKKVTSGEFTTTNLPSEEFDYRIFDDFDFYALVEKSFYDVNSVVHLMIKSLPFYYSDLVDKNFLLLKKEDLMNHFMGIYITDEVYNILFTFSRVSTLTQEEQLLKSMKKCNLGVHSDTNQSMDLLEEFYRKINPIFRKVQIDSHRSSWTNSICYNPKNTPGQRSTELETEISQSEYIRLKYENGAEKLGTLNMCQTPIEKILMIGWVSDSIKQDCSICLDDQKPIQICGDTLVSIFAYISSLSQNHFLYSHIFLAKRLTTTDQKDNCKEGYYMNILETALSLLCEYQGKTDELMVSIIDYEDCCKNNKYNSYYDNSV